MRKLPDNEETRQKLYRLRDFCDEKGVSYPPELEDFLKKEERRNARKKKA